MCTFQVAVGYAHFAVVTMEKELYTWAVSFTDLQISTVLSLFV